MEWDGPGPKAKLSSWEGMQMVMRMVWPGHHLSSRADAPGVWTERELVEPKMHSKHYIRFMSKLLLLLIIRKASLVALTHISKGYWLVRKDPPYIRCWVAIFQFHSAC